LTTEQLQELDCHIILGNTYHLGNHPGHELVDAMGGLHGFINWPRGMLTDSGGFQMVSLLHLADITEEGVEFQSPVDGSRMLLTPEQSMEIQNGLGADIIMQVGLASAPHARSLVRRSLQLAARQPAALLAAPPTAAPTRCTGCAAPSRDPHASATTQFNHARPGANHGRPENTPPQLDDVVPAINVDAARFEEATYRTTRWLDRCIKAHARPKEQSLFPIVQGGFDVRLRDASIRQLVERDCPGHAIGGLAGGEGKDVFWRVVAQCAAGLPAGKPRYVMGIGHSLDIVVCRWGGSAAGGLRVPGGLPRAGRRLRLHVAVPTLKRGAPKPVRLCGFLPPAH
jgi:queuine tRNA-ribosyltransferase